MSECSCAKWARETHGAKGPCPWHSNEPMRRVREATGLGLREARERMAELVEMGYPPDAAADALIAAGPMA